MEDLEFFLSNYYLELLINGLLMFRNICLIMFWKNSLSYQDLMVLPLSVMNQILDVLKRI